MTARAANDLDPFWMPFTANRSFKAQPRLLASALTRLDELPLRLVEPDSHGSPWHELASSDLVKDAMRAVPGFAGQVKELASKAINTLTPTKPKAPAPASSDEAS